MASDPGSGGFLATPMSLVSTDTGTPVLHFRYRSWVHADMLRNEQLVEADRLLTPRPGDQPMVLGPLNPLNLRAPSRKSA